MKPSIWFVLAMRRSGHHSVIHQIAAGVRGPAVHFNNCVHFATRMRPVVIPGRGRFVLYNEGTVRDSGPNAWMALLSRHTMGTFPLVRIYSFEDYDLARPLPRTVAGVTPRFVVVHRDPFNWIASSLAHSRIGSARLDWRITLWKKLVSEALGGSCFLGSDTIHIVFNRWVQEESYRRLVCEQLGVRCADDARNRVSPFGGGSSFDGMGFDGRGGQMNVLGRWRSVAMDARYRRILEDRDLVSLAESYFGFSSGPVLAAVRETPDSSL